MDDTVNVSHKIFRIMGLDVDSSNKVIDQDTCRPIEFKGKSIKYTSDPNKNLLIAKNDILFDPINNSRLMSTLFGYYLTKLEENEGIAFDSYYTKNGNEGRTALELKNENEKITSKYYTNDSIKYIDIILKLNGDSDIDLSEYDK